MNIRTIFFDLDETLYSSETGIWKLLVERINLFMVEHVGIAQKDTSDTRQKYLKKYGTTLRGLHIHHDVDPGEYLEFVHDIPIEEHIKANRKLETMLKQLKQNKWIWTNASKAHAERVTAALGIRGYFRGIIDIESFDFQNKPQLAAYTIAMDIAGELEGKRSLFIDDRAINLQTAKDLGANTVLVGTTEPHPAADFSIAKVEDLLRVLPQLVE